MMVVLLVVALSTATYAWYTSSNTVSTADATVNSASSTGANISIGWADNTPVGSNSLTFKTDGAIYSPMVPTIGAGASWVDENFKSNSIFTTATLSFGKLGAQSTATPYVGANPDPEASGTTFYIVNYATRATDITFSCIINGENADRLRVAVFKDGAECVFTNADFYYGETIDEIPAHYEAVLSQPSDWISHSTSYFTDDEGTPVALVAPTFQENSYYNSDGTVVIGEPEDWDDTYADYSSVAAPFTAVKGVAGAFPAGGVYKHVPDAAASINADGTVNQIDIPTTIALSNGVTGTAQGFVVKAWFDGPTQVDAYGGQNATFTLTATAS
jgi:hypothetical protein